MMNRSLITPVIAAIGVGALLFIITAAVTGLREPWDSSFYWIAAYPMAIVASAVLGYIYPDRPWRWPLWLFEAQFLAMCIRNGEPGNLWPLGMALFGIIALPAIGAAKLASKIRHGR